MNCTVEDMLRHFVTRAITNCDELLVHAQFAINNAWQESVQNTPFYLNHGHHPRTSVGASLERFVTFVTALHSNLHSLPCDFLSQQLPVLL